MPGVMGGETGRLPTLFLPNPRKEAVGQGSLWIQRWTGILCLFYVDFVIAELCQLIRSEQGRGQGQMPVGKWFLVMYSDFRARAWLPLAGLI